MPRGNTVCMLFFIITIFDNTYNMYNFPISGPNFTKAQAVLLIEKLTVEERKLFLKELKKVGVVWLLCCEAI